MKLLKLNTRGLIVVLAWFLPAMAIGQTTKNISSISQFWAGYYNQTRLSKHWGLWTDLHLRTKEDFASNFSQSILRVGGTYYLTDNTKLTLGYAYVSLYPGDNHANVTQPEHRIWQQVQWHVKFPRLRLMHWIRLEEKFKHKILNNDALADGYQFNWKLRYNFLFNTPLNRKAFAPGTLSFVLNDELHVNFGKEIVYNYFDQNRFFVGFSYHTTPTDNLQFGYMNLFQQLPAGNSYKDIHTLRVFYFHNLDLRKK
ncbi:MAG: DUF2490 domain-containing protein [Chitinophagaceae bacterium]|nr:DUF2490 domain-containing protein [Chitinophagaceae bacterium]